MKKFEALCQPADPCRCTVKEGESEIRISHEVPFSLFIYPATREAANQYLIMLGLAMTMHKISHLFLYWNIIPAGKIFSQDFSSPVQATLVKHVVLCWVLFSGPSPCAVDLQRVDHGGLSEKEQHDWEDCVDHRRKWGHWPPDGHWSGEERCQGKT